MFSEFSQSSLRLEFTDGSLCELDAKDKGTAAGANGGVVPPNMEIETTPRSATVEVFCGDR